MEGHQNKGYWQVPQIGNNNTVNYQNRRSFSVAGTFPRFVVTKILG